MSFPLFGYSNGSIIDLFMYNQNFQFVLIFILFFAVIFFATKNAFKQDKGIAVGISVVISLIISLAMAKNGLLYDYLGGEIGGWAIVFGFLIAAVFLVKLADTNLGKGAAITVIWIGFLVFLYADLANRVPGGTLAWILAKVYEIASGWIGWTFMIFATIYLASREEGWSKFGKKLFGR